MAFANRKCPDPRSLIKAFAVRCMSCHCVCEMSECTDAQAGQELRCSHLSHCPFSHTWPLKENLKPCIISTIISTEGLCIISMVGVYLNLNSLFEICLYIKALYQILYKNYKLNDSFFEAPDNVLLSLIKDTIILICPFVRDNVIKFHSVNFLTLSSIKMNL